jgi:outer membrane protein OmpA-like peptidoglycan-associated protein
VHGASYKEVHRMFANQNTSTGLFSLIAEEKQMRSIYLKSVGRILALAMVAIAPIALAAQDAPKPATKPVDDSPSRWDIFAGYSYLGPHGTVNVPQGNGAVIPYNYDSVNVGAIFSGAYYFNKYVGGQVEIAEHEWGSGSSNGSNVGQRGNNDGFVTGAAGIIFRLPMDEITPFAHGLVGAADIDGPDHNPRTWGPALTAGGGMDYATPFFNHHLAIRIFQADYEYMHADFGPGIYGGRANINAARLSGGVVWHVGTIAPPPPVTLACSASPTSVFPGDPVTVTATAGMLNPKLNAIYSFTGTGVTANGATATVATAALAPGSYTVNCGVKEGKAGKEGLRPWETASATTTFTVKEFEPPTISCSASPSTIKPGDSSTITASGMSPQNRPLTYSYSAAAGTVSGTGTSASFSSTGAPTGPVSITCNVSDDKGHSASSTTSVTITAPYVPPAPKTQALCSITFEKDKARPTRVDNEAKACLDEVALDLQKSSDAKAVIVGEANAKEKTPSKHKHAKKVDIAAERAVNTKEYLVTEKGIDASRISVATGTSDDQKVEDYLVPAGATFSSDVTGTTPVDETMVKPQVRKPLGAKHHAHHAPAKVGDSVRPPVTH